MRSKCLTTLLLPEFRMLREVRFYSVWFFQPSFYFASHLRSLRRRVDSSTLFPLPFCFAPRKKHSHNQFNPFYSHSFHSIALLAPQQIEGTNARFNGWIILISEERKCLDSTRGCSATAALPIHWIRYPTSRTSHSLTALQPLVRSLPWSPSRASRRLMG